MKLILLSVFLVTIIHFTYGIHHGENCGLSLGGPIVQLIYEKVSSADGLFWNDNNILFVDRFHPAICHVHEGDGESKCTKLDGVKNISSIFPIKRVKNKYIILADRKMILVNIVFTSDHKIANITTEDILTITTETKYTLIAGTVDKKGRLWTDATTCQNHASSKLFNIDQDGIVTELMIEVEEAHGVVFSTDYKYLFVADSKANVIYKYDVNIRKGTLGKCEVVFNATEHIHLRGVVTSITVTKDNKLWIAISRSGLLINYDWKKKNIKQIVKIPGLYIASITFGGSNYDILFAGTVSHSMESFPGAGSVFAISGTGTAGVASNKMTLPKSLSKRSDLIGYDDKLISTSDIERMFMAEEDEQEL